MSVIILHQKRSGNLELAVEYVGRPTPLGNPFTHLKKDTKAMYHVDTVEQAIDEYSNWFYSEIRTNQAMRDQLRDLDLKYQQRGILYISCWCKDELAPRASDHGCHADVVRTAITTTIPVMRYLNTCAMLLGGR